ncbi:MAG TPA: hypothetical protein VHK67_05480 [Rhabdochlamydiaceae bacterium]|jgi:hypothetical protein|nr:hypothetical protein [Rhabdochlamydiaceae bacterium]
MIPIDASCFDLSIGSTVNRDELFAKQKEFLQASKIQVDEIKKNCFRYKFIEDKDNKSIAEIKIKKSDDESFKVSFLGNGSNEVKRLSIKDSKMAEFEATCHRLRHPKESIISEADGIPGAFLAIVGLVSAVVAGIGFKHCFTTKNPSEILPALAIAVAGTAVAWMIALIFRKNITATDEANREASIRLGETMLNKHLTVIQAYMQNAKEVSQAQLLVSQKA